MSQQPAISAELQAKHDKINADLLRADQLVSEKNLPAAVELYKTVMSEVKALPSPDEEFLANLQKHITKLVGKLDNQVAAQTKKPEPQELSAGKKNWLQRQGLTFGFGDIGKNMVKSMIKKYLPKIKEMIQKNQPKAAAFMRGEIDMKFQPIPAGEKPEERIVIIRLKPGASGDITKDDIQIEIHRTQFVQVNVAKKDGKSLSLISAHSGMQFINDMLSTNLEAAIDDADFSKIG